MPSGWRLFLTILITLSFIASTGCGSYPVAPVVGALAPDFTLVNQDGKSTSLKDFRGQWVVLYFYPKDFGDFSTTLAHGFRRDLPKYNELHTVVLGLSRDQTQSHKLFANQEQIHFTLLTDQGQEVTGRYGGFQKSHGFLKAIVFRTFLVDPAGKVAGVLDNFDTDDLSGRVLRMDTALQHP